MKKSSIIYSIILGLINHYILSLLIPIYFSLNPIIIISLVLIIFILLEIKLYKNTYLKDSLINSIIKFSS